MTLNKNLLACSNCFPDDISVLPRSNDYKLYCTPCWIDKAEFETALLEADIQKRNFKKAKANWKKPGYIALLSEQDYREMIEKCLKRANRYTKRLMRRRSEMRGKLIQYTKGIVN